MSKNIKARNARTRTPMAYFGPENNPLPHPVYCTAYQKDGVTLFAVAGGKHFEVYPDTRVVVDYDPGEVAGIKGLRWCYSHEGEEPHLRLIGANVRGSQFCNKGKSDRVKAAAKAGYSSVQAMLEVQKREALEASIAHVHDRLVKPLTREELFAITLGNVARDLGTQSDRFAVLAAQYGYSMDHALTVALRELDKKGMVDASTQVSAA